MSKRRGKSEGTDAAPENLTPEERRDQRRRDRIRKKAGHEPSARGGKWRRAALIGVPIAVIAVVGAVLIVSNLPTPCITLQAVPSSAGNPAFAAHTSDPQSGNTWCPDASEVYGTAPVLKIDISGSIVQLPALIGENNSYPGGASCDLPIVTEPASDGFPTNSINIQSDWNYQYNLTTFFTIWSESFKAVAVSSSATAQPIVYQSDDILGYTANATEGVYLFVDNQLSSQGPLLDISTLDGTITTYPSCLGQIYGMGHTIMISYTNSTSKAYVPIGDGVADATIPANPEASAELFNGPLPHFGFSTPFVQAFQKMVHASLAWLDLRVR